MSRPVLPLRGSGGSLFVFLGLGLGLVLSTGCRESTGFEEGEEDSSSSSSTEGGTTDAFPGEDACTLSEDCEGGYCVASWPGETPRGAAECVDACVGELDLSLFCLDDAGCCEALSCSLDGLCEPPWTGGDGDGDGDAPGDGDGDAPGDGDGDAPGDGDGDAPGDGDGDAP